MPTTRKDITEWFESEKGNKNITHMLVVCDTFDYSDYPVYVRKNQQVREIYCEYQNKRECSKVMEVYSYNHDLEEQLNEHRAFHFD